MCTKERERALITFPVSEIFGQISKQFIPLFISIYELERDGVPSSRHKWDNFDHSSVLTQIGLGLGIIMVSWG